jgi:single-stranded-DNA-specific exonuclease
MEIEQSLINNIPLISSVGGFDWYLPDQDERKILTMIQQHNVPEIIARILSSRGCLLEAVPSYLSPTLRDLLPDPMHLRDMDIAARRLAQAVIHQHKIVIFGDYDVDGATSSSLLKRFFAEVGLAVDIYIPDRITEGYGPNVAAFQTLKQNGAEIIITVDCGTMAFEALEAAKELGMEVIVVDHHLSAEVLPPALAIINPNRLDEESSYGYLAAVGVAFLLAVAVKSTLNQLEWFANKAAPNLLNLLDLVALGTVCDVVPLIGVNRAFVTQGLKILAKRQNVGLAALYDVAGIDQAPTTYHLGFILGPRINAGGRVGKSSLGADLLVAEDYDAARIIAQQLNILNQERKAIEELMLEDAITQAERAPEGALMFVVGASWHPGVIGIIASRIKDRFNKPTAVIALENGVGKASCRSVAGVDFGAAIIAAKMEDLVVNGGGHAMAAGFTILESKLPQLQQFLSVRFESEIGRNERINYRSFDGYLTTSAITIGFAELLEKAGPYGAGNKEPRFVIAGANIVKYNIIAGSHLRLFLNADRHYNMKTITATCFKAIGTKLGDMLMTNGKAINLIGYVRINNWQGMKRAEFTIEDASYD